MIDDTMATVADFSLLGEAVHQRYNEMAAGELFVADTVDLFESYLAAFPPGTNQMFRTRTEYDCSCCRNFVRHLGSLVAIQNGEIATVWDIDNLPYPFAEVAQRMAEVVRQAPIVSVFRSKERQYGSPYSYDGETGQRWNHFHGRVTDRHHSAMPDRARGDISTVHGVFRRGLTELSSQAFDTVLELIDSNALYRGEEHRASLVAFRNLLNRYNASDNREAFVWGNVQDRSARFRNTVIGTLVTDLSEGVDLDTAVRSFESKVAPQNYKRPTAIITQKMIANALTELRALGLEDAVKRRHARLSDVSVNNVLFVDNAVQPVMRDSDGLEGLLMESVKPTPVSVKNPTDISAQDFFDKIVPKATSIDVLVENRHLPNFVSLTAPQSESTGHLFKWDNDFAWSYSGEVTDTIKERVKAAGGNVNAKLRVSLAWSNYDDLDIHCYGPEGHIYFGDRRGILDVDMNAGSGTTRQPVENLSWAANRLIDGRYRIVVNNYSKRENIDFGFSIEFEHEGRLEQFTYDRAIPTGQNVEVMEITVTKGKADFRITNSAIRGGSVSVDHWGVQTEQLVSVDTAMLSPNYWDGQEIGNRHWFFILKNCRNPDMVRGIYNEFLRSSLEPHRKVFEVLGSKTKCEPADEQLSGLGFSSTRRDSLTAVVQGRGINQAYRINF